MEITPQAKSPAAGAERLLEGRIESVKDGVAQVRLSPKLVVAAVLDPSTPVGVGTRVAVFTGSDGALQAKSLAAVVVDFKSQAVQTLLDCLPSLVGESTAASLAPSLARGDLETARQQVSQLWQQLKSLPPSQVTPELRRWMERQAPPLLSRPGEAPALSGTVSLALGSAQQPGEYFAQIAGQPSTVLGPADLVSGSKGLWQSRALPGGGAVWAPVDLASAGHPAPADLPARVPANATGAKVLLDWSGVQASPEEAASLAEFLQAVGDDFATAGREVQGDEPSSTRLDPKPALAVVRPSLGPAVELPKPVAERALVAWALELPDEPVVRQAVLGNAPTLPAALAILQPLVMAQPGRFPSLEAVLSQLASAERVDPQGVKAPHALAARREPLAEALFEALAQTDPSKPQEALRQALGQAASSLVQEALEPPRDRTQEYPPAAFSVRNQQGQLEGGRIVVHDRRSKSREQATADDHHTVEIEMCPAELGPIKAKLDLRGKLLSTRLEARETDTAALLESHADELREAFQKLGLEPTRIEVERPQAPRGDARKRGSGTALDLRV